MNKETVANRIKMFRLHLGLTQEEFGYAIDHANKGIVSRWELGYSLPSAKRMKIIADKAGSTVENFFYTPEEYLFENIDFDYKKYKLNKSDEIKKYFIDVIIDGYISVKQVEYEDIDNSDLLLFAKRNIDKAVETPLSVLGNLSEILLNQPTEKIEKYVERNFAEKILTHKQNNTQFSNQELIDFKKLFYETDVSNFKDSKQLEVNQRLLNFFMDVTTFNEKLNNNKAHPKIDHHYSFYLEKECSEIINLLERQIDKEEVNIINKSFLSFMKYNMRESIENITKYIETHYKDDLLYYDFEKED